MATPFLYNSMIQMSMPPGQMGLAGQTGATGQTGTTSQTGTTGQAGMFFGPTGMGATSLGLLLLANQQQQGGIGSGRLSGVRGDARPQPAAGAPATSKQRASARPGGLAARYFNRPTSRAAYPARYFARQTRYFP
jgi:hypothetical protein